MKPAEGRFPAALCRDGTVNGFFDNFVGADAGAAGHRPLIGWLGERFFAECSVQIRTKTGNLNGLAMDLNRSWPLRGAAAVQETAALCQSGQAAPSMVVNKAALPVPARFDPRSFRVWIKCELCWGLARKPVPDRDTLMRCPQGGDLRPTVSDRSRPRSAPGIIAALAGPAGGGSSSVPQRNGQCHPSSIFLSRAQQNRDAPSQSQKNLFGTWIYVPVTNCGFDRKFTIWKGS